MDKNLTVKIEDLDMNGLGIAHENSNTIFVDNALPQELIDCEILNKKGSIFYAKNLNIRQKSTSRAIPKCPYFGFCGGCDLQHLEYKNQLEFKKQQIKLTLKKVANICVDDFKIVESDNEYFYRNKITMKIERVNNEKVLCLYKKNSRTPIQIDSCKIMDKNFDFIIKSINNYLKICKLKVYNKTSNTGTLKHLVCRIIDNDVLLTFVLNKKEMLNEIETLYNALKSQFTNIGISLNINKNDNEILSNNFINVIGVNEINFENFGISQKITNASFLQVNKNIEHKLYNYVLNNISGNIVNCYSGAGLLSGILAKNNPKNQIFGIEINKNATMLANKLKKENGIFNLENYCGDAGDVLEKLNLKNYNLVLDPPRSGLDNKMINIILKNLPDKILYISCDKVSLAKNLKQLLTNYNLSSITAFDMFPQTKNVETVVILNKK